MAKGSSELAKLKAKAVAMLPSKRAPPPPAPPGEGAAEGAEAGGDAEAGEREGERRANMATRFDLADRSKAALQGVREQAAKIGDRVKKHTVHVAKHFGSHKKQNQINKKLRARNRWQVGERPSHTHMKPAFTARTSTPNSSAHPFC